MASFLARSIKNQRDVVLIATETACSAVAAPQSGLGGQTAGAPTKLSCQNPQKTLISALKVPTSGGFLGKDAHFSSGYVICCRHPTHANCRHLGFWTIVSLNFDIVGRQHPRGETASHARTMSSLSLN